MMNCRGLALGAPWGLIHRCSLLHVTGAARPRIGCVSVPMLVRVQGVLPLLIAATTEFFGTMVDAKLVYSISATRDKYSDGHDHAGS